MAKFTAFSFSKFEVLLNALHHPLNPFVDLLCLNWFHFFFETFHLQGFQEKSQLKNEPQKNCRQRVSFFKSSLLRDIQTLKYYKKL